jgi:hypothetical protein
VANVTNPKTPAQLDQRASIYLMVDFLKPLTSFRRQGFKSLASKMTAYNAAMSYNIENAIIGIYPVFTIDYTSVKVSNGNLPGSLNAGINSTVSGEVAFTWEVNSGDAGADALDKAMLVVYNPAKGLSVSIAAGNTRASESQVVTVPNLFAGDEVQCYLSFSNANGSVCSDSQYVGAVDVV